MFLHVHPIAFRTPPRLAKPGFYLWGLSTDYELHDDPWWLGLDPVAGLRAFSALDEGYYAILVRQPDSPKVSEWGTPCVWKSTATRKAGWRLRALSGRPVIVPGALTFGGIAMPANGADENERGGLLCG